MTFSKKHWPFLIMAAFILLRLLPEITRTDFEGQFSVVSGDMVAYATVLTQSSNLGDLRGDLLYGDGLREAVFWDNTRLYMIGLSALHRLTGQNIEQSVRLYSVLAMALYLPGMYAFLLAMTRHKGLALGLALASLAPARFALTGTLWGFPSHLVVPFVIYTACAPWLAWLLYRYWFAPESLHKNSAKFWQVIGLGALCGLSLSQLHSISGLNFIQVVGLLALIQLIRGKLSLMSLIAFLIGGAITAPLYLLSGRAGNVAGEGYGFEAARVIIDWARVSMVFPWSSTGRYPALTVEAAETRYFWLITAHFVLSVGLLLVYLTPRPPLRSQRGGVKDTLLQPKGAKGTPLGDFGTQADGVQADGIQADGVQADGIQAGAIPTNTTPSHEREAFAPPLCLRRGGWGVRSERGRGVRSERGQGVGGAAFVLIQVSAALLFMNVGWLPLLLLWYGWRGIWRGKISELDFGLGLLFALSLLAGTFQQMAAYYIWEAFELTPLTSLLFEMGRFVQFAYLPLYALLARAGLAALDDLGLKANQTWGVALSLAWAGVILLSLNRVPYPFDSAQGRSSFGLAEMLILLTLAVLLLAKRLKQIKAPQLPPIWAYAACGLLLMGFTAQLWPSPTPQYGSNSALSADYSAMVAWIDANLPDDARLHPIQADGKLRYYARCGIVIDLSEWIYGMYTDIDPLYLWDVQNNFYLTPFDAQHRYRLFQELGVTHVLYQHRLLETPLFIGEEAAQIYQNASYTVLEVAALPSEQSRLALYPDVYVAYQAQPRNPDLPPPDALIFNPAQGYVASRQVELDFMGERLNDPTFEISNEDQARVLDWARMVEQMRFGVELLAGAERRAHLEAWREDKAAEHLRAAGVDYLFYAGGWSGFLAEAELAALHDPNQYEVVAVWEHPAIPQAYTLLRVLD